ncbi:dienelactone hydrolase family protein [Actinomadura madurae]|uniref:dienelactone hydrolase family protein n=1 Tax=Actinomadura madurae TaxID=1993 RepID=UPI002025E768|nr:dienelactone hydrolase family protein [Actinomadura madurae]MCP9949341.1 dienelactone hydrolase family protein [Actinomadura madurae]MCP9978584.1 dienelactone hydrolase family protein [Actinomadura madurae]MCQ0009888.1 dienelactone hydrolase family protein [Actinomadura madurae]MCQ0014787.1 dienelactone hydrolase family protein [Actinomadura madurae]URM94888.1 dienelactone hydrolase family protein [Actinomadura madurae]
MITLRLPDAELGGDLALPDAATGVVLFAHGSGSSRHSPRNRAVAQGLNAAGIGTLLIDLLTEHEDEIDRVTAALRFDIELLTLRLIGAIDALADGLESAPHTAGLRIGLFGASTGAAAALAAAAARPQIGAVVSRGGRPDLAGPSLARVRAPVLLIVGGRDTDVLELNRKASESLEDSEVHVISGAGHLFEEPGGLEEVTTQAADWFNRHL